MTQFEIWKLVTDFGLLGSLLFFAYRFLRSQTPVNTHKLEELQHNLRSAIREADQAGKGLNEQFLQRKQHLEKLLFELETAESRVNRAINNAEEKKSDLEFEIKKSINYRQEYNPPPSPVIQKKQDLLEVDHDEFSAAVNPSSARSDGANTNIFGEPLNDNVENYQPNIKRNNNISSVNIEKAFGNTPLTEKIEREVEIYQPAKTQEKPKKLSLEEVYAEAEEMLKAGRAVGEISRQTNLTAEEIRILAQMLEKERVEQEQIQSPREEDNRLGVLAGFKRQTQVL